MLTQGSKDHPVKLNDHFFGPIIKSVHWGSWARLEITGPSDAAFSFNADGGMTTKNYNAGDTIDKSAVDSTTAAVILVGFTEPNPVSTGNNWVYKQLASIYPLLVNPSILVIEAPEDIGFQDLDQAFVDNGVAFQNTLFAGRQTIQNQGNQKILDDFKTQFHDGEVIGPINNLNDYFPGHPAQRISYDDSPWVREPAPDSTPQDKKYIFHGNRVTVTKPAGEFWWTDNGWAINPGQGPLVPIHQVTFYIGKYPVAEDVARNCYLVNLSRIGTNPVRVTLEHTTIHHSGKAVDFVLSLGGGNFKAAPKRHITSDTVTQSFTKSADASRHVGTIMCQFDRTGFR